MTARKAGSLLLLLMGALLFQGWGFSVHRQVHRAAVHALPAPLRGWFEREVDWLAEHAVDADKRKHRVEREAPRHYLDLDAPALSCLDTLGPVPTWSKAVASCTEDTLWAYGVLPWNVDWSYRRLVQAFHEQNREAILRAASDLGHYVGDAHVPLHTTLNYNGQLTGQKGIHALWETRLPELFGAEYFLAVPEPIWIPNVSAWTWARIQESHAAVDSVLRLDREAVAAWSGDLVVREQRGRVVQQQRVVSWCKGYHDQLDGMVERRWRASIHGVASLWWSAWVEAGQPNLEGVLGAIPPCSVWRRWRKKCSPLEGNP